jgi:cytochrome c biogenesis protein CcdA
MADLLFTLLMFAVGLAVPVLGLYFAVRLILAVIHRLERPS